MTVSRRRILVGATALTAAALAGRLAAYGNTESSALRLPENLVAPGMHALVLHDGSVAALEFARAVRVSVTACRVSECAVRLLSLAGFNEAGARLDAARGGTLLSLLDDADTVVVEALLKARNVVRLVRQRQGHQVLLTACLQR